MTSTKPGSRVGGIRREVDYQKLGSALLIASSLVLALRRARWYPTLSDGLANIEWEKEVKHSVRIAKNVLSHLTVALIAIWVLRQAKRNSGKRGQEEKPKGFVPLRPRGGRRVSFFLYL
jgi:hypothetical protein